jgi:hypothetical protein
MPRRTAWIRRTTAIRRKPRTRSESERSYGTPEHQDWLRGHPCLGCARIGTEDRPHHLHHTQNGGGGRKADARRQVPLCASCHGWLHDHGAKSFEAAFADMLCGRTLVSWAATYAEAWKQWAGEVAS